MFLNHLKRIIPDVYKNMFNFTGRTKRAQYFIDILVCMIVTLIMALIFIRTKADRRAVQEVSTVLGILNTTSAVSVTVRRLRDAGYPGFNILLALIPIAGPIWVTYELCQESGHNCYQSATEYYKRLSEGEANAK